MSSFIIEKSRVDPASVYPGPAAIVISSGGLMAVNATWYCDVINTCRRTEALTKRGNPSLTLRHLSEVSSRRRKLMRVSRGRADAARAPRISRDFETSSDKHPRRPQARCRDSKSKSIVTTRVHGQSRITAPPRRR